ncbi:MAG: 16S rRNA (uracil(1498)-N(3))-methyltransferase [Rubellimicrobium sp.]|nr:16S rRNA (uracil(1498)-N(3))-methyltransferase [Rubellimicrobium sp.]
MSAVPRLHVDHPLSEGQTVPLSQGQVHYLGNVLRLGAGAEVTLFNGHDGEWRARIAELAKRGGLLLAEVRLRAQVMPPDLWLVFAPIRKARLEVLVEKAVELGVARLVPVLTERTNAERVRPEKMEAHALEAAEQCGALFVPPVAPPARLGAVLDAWPEGRDLWFCDEALAGSGNVEPPREAGPGAVLIGPEGGFSSAERDQLAALPFARRIALGPRILRAETAALAALVLWQSLRGDWR